MWRHSNFQFILVCDWEAEKYLSNKITSTILLEYSHNIKLYNYLGWKLPLRPTSLY